MYPKSKLSKKPKDDMAINVTRILCGPEEEEEADQDLGTITKEEKPRLKKPPLYKVVLVNDDYTPMEFVVHVLQKFFGRSSGEATQIMLNVHQRGIGVCGVYSFEIAESKAQKTIDYARKNDHPLQLQLEKE